MGRNTQVRSAWPNRIESGLERSVVHGAAIRIHQVLGHVARGAMAGVTPLSFVRVTR